MITKVKYKTYKRFIGTYSDEMGTYGKYVDDVMILDEHDELICIRADLIDFLNNPVSKLVDTTNIHNIIKHIP